MMETSKLLYIRKSKGYISMIIYIQLLKWTLRLELFLLNRKKHRLPKQFNEEIKFYLKEN